MKKRALAIALVMMLVFLTTPGAVIAEAGVTNTGAVGFNPSVSGSIIAFVTYEGSIGQDLNGDGDQYDAVIRFYDIASGETLNTGAVGQYPSASGSIIAFSTWEGSIGQDLNGDGDTSDTIIRYFDWFIWYYGNAVVTAYNTGAEGQYPSASGSIIAFVTYEGPIGQDLNGDGDQYDLVIRYYDTATHTVTNIGAVGYYPSVSGSIIAFSTSEYSIGQDLNGDGDQYDPVIRYYDTATGTVTNTGAVGFNPSVSGSIIALQTGDAAGGVIRYFTIPEAGTIESIKALIDAYLADRSIDNEGVAQALYAFLEQAQANIDRGNNQAAINTLKAFIKLVQAQAGKHISAPAAQTLTDAAQTVIGGLQ